MGWYGKLTQLFRKKKPATTKTDTTKPQRDLLAPTARTQDAIKKLKASGLSDKEISRMMYGR